MELTRTLKPGFYAVELNKTVWIIPNCYQNLTPVGTGAYGTVWLVCCSVIIFLILLILYCPTVLVVQ